MLVLICIGYVHGINPHACPCTQLIDLVLHLVISSVQYCIFQELLNGVTCLIKKYRAINESIQGDVAMVQGLCNSMAMAHLLKRGN